MNTSTPNALQAIFAVFFAIFWGVVANAQPKWRAFNWPVAFKHPRTRRRLVVAVLLLNLLPILIFIAVFMLLAKAQYDTTCWTVPFLRPVPGRAILQIFLVIVAANAPFPMHRFWIGWLERNPERYYYRGSEELDLLPAIEPKLTGDGTDLGANGLTLDPAWSAKNLQVSTAHLALCLAAAGALWLGGSWLFGAVALIIAIVAWLIVWAWRVREGQAATASRRQALTDAFARHDWSSVLRICAEEIETSSSTAQSLQKGSE